MRFGNHRIKGFSKRFYFIIAGLLLLFIAAQAFGGSPTPKANPIIDPAFAVAELHAAPLQHSGWTGNRISAYGLFHPSLMTDFTGANYVRNLGLPMRFKAYIPDPTTVSSSRPDLFVHQDGYTFEPAQFVSPNQSLSLTNLSSSGSSSLTQPLMLGFRDGQTPPPTQAYEVTGLLWWRSDRLNPAPSQTGSNAGSAPLASPVVLVDSYAQLSPAELRAPTTQRVDLNLNYQEGNEALNLQRIEWSAGHELRLCLSVTNTTGQAINLWSGINAITADNGQGAVTGTPDAAGAFSSGTQLQPYQTESGYVTFDASASDPSQPLTVRAPSLSTAGAGASNSQQQDSFIIRVPQQAIQNVSAVQSPTTNCGGTQAAAVNTAAPNLSLGGAPASASAAGTSAPVSGASGS